MELLQSWWEVPSIAHFCSLFRAAFNLLDFDIEDLEEGLLASGSSSDNGLVQHLVIQLLQGYYQRPDIILQSNFEKYLKELLVKRWTEERKDTSVLMNGSFASYSLRTKVEILYSLCDYRLDAADVMDVLKNLESDSLRVEPLGRDNEGSTYWYFYGTRLYKEEPSGLKKRTSHKKGEKQKKENLEKSLKDKKKHTKPGESGKDLQMETDLKNLKHDNDIEAGETVAAVNGKTSKTKTGWSIVCSTEEDWKNLCEKFRKSRSKKEKEFYNCLANDFVPEIGRVFLDKARLTRKRLLESLPRRTSHRIERLKQSERDVMVIQQEADMQRKIEGEMFRQKHEEEKKQRDTQEREDRAKERMLAKEERAIRAQLREDKHFNNQISGLSNIKRNDSADIKTRIRNCSVIVETDDDLFTGMYKVFEALQRHKDSWPFLQPVEEDYAPGYFRVIKKPIDLSLIEKKLQRGEYFTKEDFESDIILMFDNCFEYNGPDSEYTTMAQNLKDVFYKVMEKVFPEDSDDNSCESIEDEECTIRKKCSRPKQLVAKTREVVCEDNSSPVWNEFNESNAEKAIEFNDGSQTVIDLSPVQELSAVHLEIQKDTCSMDITNNNSTGEKLDSFEFARQADSIIALETDEPHPGQLILQKSITVGTQTKGPDFESQLNEVNVPKNCCGKEGLKHVTKPVDKKQTDPVGFHKLPISVITATAIRTKTAEARALSSNAIKEPPVSRVTISRTLPLKAHSPKAPEQSLLSGKVQHVEEPVKAMTITNQITNVPECKMKGIKKERFMPACIKSDFGIVSKDKSTKIGRVTGIRHIHQSCAVKTFTPDVNCNLSGGIQPYSATSVNITPDHRSDLGNNESQRLTTETQYNVVKSETVGMEIAPQQVFLIVPSPKTTESASLPPVQQHPVNQFTQVQVPYGSLPQNVYPMQTLTTNYPGQVVASSGSNIVQLAGVSSPTITAMSASVPTTFQVIHQPIQINYQLPPPVLGSMVYQQFATPMQQVLPQSGTLISSQVPAYHVGQQQQLYGDQKIVAVQPPAILQMCSNQLLSPPIQSDIGQYFGAISRPP